MKYSAFIEAEGVFAFALRFLAEAINDSDALNPTMPYIGIEMSDKGDGQMLGVTTDGRHLHLVDPIGELASILELTPGYWKVVKKTSKRICIARLDDNETKGWVKLNWRKILPSEEAIYKTTFSGFDLVRYGHKSRELAIFLHDFPDITAVDLNYLHSLGTGCIWNVEWYGAHKAMKFTKDNRMALIMPMSTE